MTGAQWLLQLDDPETRPPVGLVHVASYDRAKRPPAEVLLLEKAAEYGAQSVFFEAPHHGRPAQAQAFVFTSDGPADSPEFAKTHRRLWSWGGVPLVYRKSRGLIQLFRCAHKPDFFSQSEEPVCKPVKIIGDLTRITKELETDPWWDAAQIYNGALWDDQQASKLLLNRDRAAQKSLIESVKTLKNRLDERGILPQHLRRKLLILSLLIAYLEDRKVLRNEYFAEFRDGASDFFEVLENGPALVKLLRDLEERFNGDVFVLTKDDAESLASSQRLASFAHLVEGRQEPSGQHHLWRLYSFADLPVELISHIYQLFVEDSSSSVYTPPFLVRMILGELMDEERIDRLHERNEIILDPACGSGVFLVEAFKRLVLHWRYRNDWQRPKPKDLKQLLQRVHGIDRDEGAVELTAFSLCVALCDALPTDTIRTNRRLFPKLEGSTLHRACFFDAQRDKLLKQRVGVVVGNPPFKSKLTTTGAHRSYDEYLQEKGFPVPDKQLANLFIHEGMRHLTQGGVIAILQPHSFLYNETVSSFRVDFFERWNVREIIDLISVRGLFRGGNADPKVVVIVARAEKPPPNSRILHATFRRSARVRAEQGFEIDYYDMHWVPHQLALDNEGVWRANLLGDGRVLSLVDRLKEYRTLAQYAADKNWEIGEGFIEGKTGNLKKASHLTGKQLIEPKHLEAGASLSNLRKVDARKFKSPYSESRFRAPLLLVREHENLASRALLRGYYTYQHEIVGVAAPHTDADKIERLQSWFQTMRKPLQAFAAAAGTRLFTQRQSSVHKQDIERLPYPENETLDITQNEQIIVDDIVDYYRDFIRLGQESSVMQPCDRTSLEAYNTVLLRQINAIYRSNPLNVIPAERWDGFICQPYVFGRGDVDWSGSESLKDRLRTLVREKHETELYVNRIVRIYDDRFIFLLKPDRLRYWLRSIALRDADDIIVDLRGHGF